MKPNSFIGKALSDGENPSAMRVVVVLGCLSIIGVWVIASVCKGTVQDFPQSVVEVLGALIVGKVAQSHVESKTP